MAHIEFLDETMRDGQQSLWGMRMQAGMALPVAPLIDRSGFRVIDLAGSSLFEVMIRNCRENPWDGLDLLVGAMPRTRVRGGMRSNASVTFGVTPDSLMDAWMRRLNVHGCHSFWIYDVLFNIDKMHRLAKVAKEFGSEVAGAIMFALSPVHTDAYYADKADKLSMSPDIDTLLLYDTAGVLDKDRLQTLVPAIRAKARGKPIEFHANNILGQSAKAYIDIIDFGVTILHTASRPMANGPSVPSTEIMIHNIELLGHTHNIDKSLLPPVADHFERVGKAAGFPVNQANEYDVLSIRHQIPGGMTGTLKAQLAQHNMTDKLDEVLRETAGAARPGVPRNGDAFQPARRHSGRPQHRHRQALQHRPGRGSPICGGLLWRTGRADRSGRSRQDHGGPARQAGDRQSARTAHHRGAAPALWHRRRR
jgi:oxaloacetate decarboxylase (Na+ extruding) subunit alpha